MTKRLDSFWSSGLDAVRRTYLHQERSRLHCDMNHSSGYRILEQPQQHRRPRAHTEKASKLISSFPSGSGDENPMQRQRDKYQYMRDELGVYVCVVEVPRSNVFPTQDI